MVERPIGPPGLGDGCRWTIGAAQRAGLRQPWARPTECDDDAAQPRRGEIARPGALIAPRWGSGRRLDADPGLAAAPQRPGL